MGRYWSCDDSLRLQNANYKHLLVVVARDGRMIATRFYLLGAGAVIVLYPHAKNEFAQLV